MKALDATFLVDYLEGVADAAAFLESDDTPIYYAPATVMYEVYEGAARYPGSSIEKAQQSLDWVETLEFDDQAAAEAALVKSELVDHGQPINSGDVLIAGLCRRYGASLVTRDSDFDAVAGLETVHY